MNQSVSSRPMLTVPEVAGLLGVSDNTIYRRIADGDIPSKRLGKAVRIPSSWVQSFIDGAA